MTDYAYPDAWANGPDLVYGTLARAAVAMLPRAGPCALDVGSGTGAFARALTDRGARVVAVDRSTAMLGYERSGRPPAIAADVCALPLRAGCVDVAVAGFVLNHVADPVRGLAELARVSRDTVLATTFPTDGGPHPVKTALDGVLANHDYRPPDWYAALKSTGEQRIGSVAAFRAVAVSAGLTPVDVHRLEVDLSGLTAGELIRWRLGMANVAGWAAALPPDRRARLVAEALDRVGGAPPTPLPMLVLLAHRSRRR